MTVACTPGTPARSPLDALLSAVLGRRVRGLSVEVCGGALVLRGRTDSFHVKQLAQHTAMAVTELPLAANEIEVIRPRRAVLATGDDRTMVIGRECLTALGWEVVTAAGGVECVARIRESRPDLVLLDTDLQWGGADGVIANFAEGPGQRIPVVLLGGLTAWRLSGTKHLVAAVVDKPVDRETLSAAVWAATTGRNPTEHQANPLELGRQ